jgi:hypothetical protein
MKGIQMNIKNLRLVMVWSGKPGPGMAMQGEAHE